MANIVVCADGTWNRPEEDIQKDFPTNVLRVARAIDPNLKHVRQHVFYDWGLGSYHSGALAGGFGIGIHKNILDGYRYIVQNYTPGDSIYLFGFSRGAYTVRALCGLINNCGILKREHANVISRAWRIYKSPLDTNKPSGEAAKAFRVQSHTSNSIHFVGCWDTVGALGIPFSLMGLFDGNDEFYDTKMGANVSIVRHAMAIDEKRQDFEPTIWTPNSGVDLKQVWFAGVHTDVGGSCEPDGVTNTVASDIPLQWMLGEAATAGLGIEQHVFNRLTDGTLASTHKSRKHIFRRNRPLERELVIKNKPTLIHPTVKTRYLADSRYRPPQLKKLVNDMGWDSLAVGE
jgi:uncharacterized protein (DUF2235 family)